MTTSKVLSHFLFLCALTLVFAALPAMAQEGPPPVECDAHGGHGGNEPVIIIVNEVPICILFCENVCFTVIPSAKPVYSVGFDRYEERLRGVTLMQLTYFAPVEAKPVDESNCDIAACYEHQ